MKAILLCTALLAAALSPAAAQPAELPHVTVTGEAGISVAPDLAIVTAGAVSQGKTAREALTANNKLVAAVIAALKESGVAETDMQTSRVTVEAMIDRQAAQRITGFQATNRVTVQVRDVSKIGEVLDKLVSAGANSISGLEFIVSNASKLLDKARAEAIADARRKAEIYAQAAGVGLGRAIAIAEEGVPSPRFVKRLAAPAAVPIAPGEEKIGIAVSVTYELLR